MLIKLNQLGFKPNSEKIAVIPNVSTTGFTVINTRDDSVVLRGDLSAAKTWAPSGESVKLADFSSLTAIGDYKIHVAGVENPANFSIAPDAYDALNKGAIKSFYYNRSGIELLESYAGVYHRAAGHLDPRVLIHASAATTARPANTAISVSKGWYDAGDYNLYIVNSGITTYTLLAAYEAFPDYFDRQHLNIPESAHAVPDLLSEIMWNLEWMLAMQDPNDGGVYHKLTSKAFSGFVMPAADTATRYVVQKTTAAALNFAAVMATASRIYANFEAAFSGVSAKMLTAAENAWAWAKANPAIYFVQPSDISTGTYSENNLIENFAWAAAEFYITTRDEKYYTELNPGSLEANVPWWGGVKSLGWISLGRHINSLTPVADKELIKSRLDAVAAEIATQKSASAYGVAIEASEIGWGSNSVVMNKAMMLLVAYDLDKTKTQYLQSAQALLDYVLGRNATGYSFVTGFGSLTPQNIHHRLSVADGIAAPIPGFLVGGPNPGQEDKLECSVAYPSTLPAKSYLDDPSSYASNEIAINWNAPLVYVSAGVQYLTE